MSLKEAAALALFAIVRGIAWLLLLIGGLSFWIGGRALHEFAPINRFLAELLGLAVALVRGTLGFFVKAYTEQ